MSTGGYILCLWHRMVVNENFVFISLLVANGAGGSFESVLWSTFILISDIQCCEISILHPSRLKQSV